MLGGGEAGLGDAHVQALAQVVVRLGLVAVDRVGREARDEADRLAQHVRDVGAVGVAVERVGGEHAARELVHHVGRRHAEDGVLLEPVGERALRVERGGELRELVLRGEVAHEKQEADLLEAEAALGLEAADDVADLDAAVEQAPGDRDDLLLEDGVADDGRDGREADEDAGAVRVAEAALDVVDAVEVRVDAGGLGGHRGVALDEVGVERGDAGRDGVGDDGGGGVRFHAGFLPWASRG